jgi:nitroimidazol reductase NimA-like FMN-containing flavoprotein (pyridoxamine 5'-phosphate oxidase superfamily)
MSNTRNGLKQRIRSFLTRQKIAVLATGDKKELYESLVAFTVSENLRQIVFATERGTRKYSNMKTKPAVALLVDDRVNTKNDFYKTTAITITGKAAELSGREGTRLLRKHIDRHRRIRDFLRSEKCAIFKITTKAFYVITSFKNVETLTL